MFFGHNDYCVDHKHGHYDQIRPSIRKPQTARRSRGRGRGRGGVARSRGLDAEAGAAETEAQPRPRLRRKGEADTGAKSSAKRPKKLTFFRQTSETDSASTSDSEFKPDFCNDNSSSSSSDFDESTSTHESE